MSDDKYGPRNPLDVLNTRGLTAKREYVRGLEQRRDREALSLLVECLCDESPYLRELAEETFLRLGDEHAPSLVPLLDQGLWFTRTSAARVLGRLGHRAAVPGLLRLAEDDNETVQRTAIEALITLAQHRGAARVAHALHRLPAESRVRHLEAIRIRDREVGEQLERLMKSDELMSRENADGISDDDPAVRAAEQGVERKQPAGPPPPGARPDGESAGPAGEPRA